MKEQINTLISIFTRVVSAIFVFTSIYLACFVGFSATFKLKDILFILLIGLISAVCYLPMLGDRTFSKAQMLALQIGYFLVINTVVLVTGYFLTWFCFEDKLSFIAFEGVIIAVYLIVMFVSYKVDSGSAEKMNKRLRDRNSSR
ncbi:MAG: DUF3021 family protein [Spirochaetaceae bacterium]|nr:DUF3021 family protein [Spirochaetaceae bacterium]MBR3813950.1 DUF3021 family protein [Spirochaetaceae bacterium]MDD6486012.1 DUF3021 family protein [Spirochaetales bacterium]